jgi:peptide chain release factor 1
MSQAEQYLKNEIERIDRIIKANEAIRNSAGSDTELKKLAEEEIESLNKQKSTLINSLNSNESGFSETSTQEDGDPINPNIVTIEIRAGTGGNEAGLFAFDLYRMYLRYGEKNNWKVDEIFKSENEIGGIKTISSEIRGKNVYKLLKNESGVHRVQRVPTTEAGGRIHTSTATVAVLPKLEKVNVEIHPNDLQWDFFRSGGKGGQNVNKVSTAVRLTHVPTGVVVECQEERFQGKNRQKALEILNSRLYNLMQDQAVKHISDLRTVQVGTGERNEKIRTYNYPQNRVTDHRLNKSWYGIGMIMDGGIGKILETCSAKIGVPSKTGV